MAPKTKDLKLCFIPGYACSGDIFSEISRLFPSSFIVDYPLSSMGKIDTMDKLCELVLQKYQDQLIDCDAIIGHSLGGGVAMQLSLSPKFKLKKIVLLDYFLDTPPPFFRNYCSDQTSSQIHQQVKTMLSSLKPHFNIAVTSSGDDYSYDFLKRRHQINQEKLIAIYGMRSEKDPMIVKKHLNYTNDFDRFIDFYFIEQSAHFPMLENPSDLHKLLLQTLIC
ncbi:MAG: hypothetical protein KC646_01390 [Candidatus Cloacimonetes bacterium]|nr:hypothetical protein [Candidatus Cloacimonadota bacterium]